jgi:hypothetical protein
VEASRERDADETYCQDGWPGVVGAREMMAAKLVVVVVVVDDMVARWV